MKQDRIRVRVWASEEASVRQRVRLWFAARRLRRMVSRVGFEQAARLLEQAGAETGVTVSQVHPDLPRVRRCPVDSDCEPLVGWEAFLAHVYELHTDDSDPEWRRQEIVQRMLERGPAR